MPTYDYECDHCGAEKEVIKSIKLASEPENCTECGQVLRKLLPKRIHFLGEKVQHAEYNPAFGQVVKDKYHRSELAKRNNVVEIGNEKPDKMRADFAKDRDKKRRAAWEKV